MISSRCFVSCVPSAMSAATTDHTYGRRCDLSGYIDILNHTLLRGYKVPIKDIVTLTLGCRKDDVIISDYSFGERLSKCIFVLDGREVRT